MAVESFNAPEGEQSSPTVELYGAEYYKVGCGPLPYERNDQWLAFFGSAADQLIRSLKPKKVWDAGCAMGMLVESFWDRGVEAWGVDISEYAISQVRRDMQAFCQVGSVLDPLPRAVGSDPFDLVTCIEVLEHLPPEEVHPAVEQLTRIGDRIFFSSSPSDFQEPTHYCVRPPIFWLKLFAEFGFLPDLAFDGSFLAPHAILFRRTAEPVPEGLLPLFSERIRLKGALVEREIRIGRLQDSTKQVSELQAKIPALDELNQHLRASLNQAEQEAAARERLLRDQQIALDLGRTQTARFIAQAELKRKRLDAATQQLENRIREVAGLQTERRALIEEFGKQVHRYGLEHEQLTSRAGRMEQQLHHANSALAEREFAVTSLNQEIAVRHDEIALLREELESSRKGPAWAAASRAVKWFAVFQQTRRPQLTAPASGPKDLQQHVVHEERILAAPKQSYQEWVKFQAPAPARVALDRELAANLAYQPLISVLVPIFKVPRQVVAEMVESVLDQIYPNWELCLIHADANDLEVARLLAEYAARDPRIKLRTLPENLGIAANSNAALELVEGEFIALLDHDDVLAPSALFENVRALSEDPSIDFLYSDKDQLHETTSARVDPLFKPQWSPDIMWSANYLTHLCVMRTSIVRQIGGWRTETDGAQDWDLFLRVIRAGGQVHHIPKVLYHWRRIATSVAMHGLAAKPYVTESQRFCLRDHLQQSGWRAEPVLLESGYWKLVWDQSCQVPVSIICDLGPNEASVVLDHAQALRTATEYPAFEIVYPVYNSSSANVPNVRFVEVAADATALDRFQTAADSCLSPWLVFLDGSVQPGDPAWLAELTAPLHHRDIGVVGAKLVDSVTGHLRHAGICFNRDGNLAYPFGGQPEHVYNAFGAANWYRNWSAVSGACMAVRRDDWNSLGGFRGPQDFPRLDVHLCLRLQFERGLRVFYNPFARMRQDRSAALEEWQSSPHWGAAYFQACFPGGDPYFNSNLISTAGSVDLFDPEAKTDPPTVKDQAQENRELVGAFDFNAQQMAASREATSRPGTGALNRITWIIPDFTVAFYGGIHTIFRFADTFLRQHGVHSDFVFLGHAHPAIVRSRIESAFPALGADAGVIKLRSYADFDTVPESDCTISTLWTTAYAALAFNRTRRKFYFVQDYEPLFYAAGSVSALVDATYGFGYIGLCNTVELKERYLEHGSPAEFFTPSIDTSVFFPGARRADNGNPYRLFCYARPSHPRNCFELLAAVLRKLKQRFGSELQIVTAGADWDPDTEGLKGIVENLGILGYRETGALYRSCDAGTVMMMTAHPSYLPLELMACGALVITNHNIGTKWLLRDEENCLLAAPSASSFAERIEQGLRDTTLRRRITEAAQIMVQQSYSDWDGQAEKTYRYMQSQV